MKTIFHTLSKKALLTGGIALMMALTGCSEDNKSDLRLEGDTWLTALELDGQYEGVIDRSTKTVTVAVPEVYDTQAVEVSAIEVSAGAEASVKAGDVLNFSYPQVIHVANGDVYMDYTCDAGYRITNSTAQWHIGSDWGGYPDTATWRELHGGIDLGYGGDGAIVAWEYPTADGKGGIVCIGSGCYDWYAFGVDASADKYHGNVATMTENAINYLTNE